MSAPLFFGLYGNDDEGGEQDENQHIMSEGPLKPIFWTRQLEQLELDRCATFVLCPDGNTTWVL